MRMISRSLVPLLVLVPAFSLRAQTPSVAENGVLNSASYVTVGQAGFAVSPGSLVAIFGQDLAAQLTVASSVPLSTSLADVSVRFNDVPAPLLFVSPGQINAQLPWDLLGPEQETGTATVVVSRGTNRSVSRQIQLARFSPGIYTLSGNGIGGAVSVNASDGSVSQPAGSVPGITTRPVKAKEAIIVYASGLGPVDKPLPNGADSLDQLRRTLTTPTVLIDGREAEVLFSGLSPQFPAVNQLNLVVPDGVRAGNEIPIQIRIGGITTSNRITIATQN